MIKSRKLVYDTLEFEHRGRIPRELWTLPWAELHYSKEVQNIIRDFPSDIVTAPELFKVIPERKGLQYGQGEFTDEWGCVFYGIEKGIIGEVKEPLLKDWQDIEKLKIPHERLSLDRGSEQVLLEYRKICNCAYCCQTI